jgi:hypothetical protein
MLTMKSMFYDRQQSSNRPGLCDRRKPVANRRTSAPGTEKISSAQAQTGVPSKSKRKRGYMDSEAGPKQRATKSIEDRN